MALVALLPVYVLGFPVFRNMHRRLSTMALTTFCLTVTVKQGLSLDQQAPHRRLDQHCH